MEPSKPHCTCRYASRDDFVKTHRTSQAFLAYKAAVAKLKAFEVAGQSYYESNLGYM
jgi:hypothetical protein